MEIFENFTFIGLMHGGEKDPLIYEYNNVIFLKLLEKNYTLQEKATLYIEHNIRFRKHKTTDRNLNMIVKYIDYLTNFDVYYADPRHENNPTKKENESLKDFIKKNIYEKGTLKFSIVPNKTSAGEKYVGVVYDALMKLKDTRNDVYEKLMKIIDDDIEKKVFNKTSHPETYLMDIFTIARVLRKNHTGPVFFVMGKNHTKNIERILRIMKV